MLVSVVFSKRLLPLQIREKDRELIDSFSPDREQVWSSKDVEKTKVLDGYGFETGVGKEVSKQLNGMIASKKSMNVTSPDKIELGDQHATALKHKGKQGNTEKMP